MDENNKDLNIFQLIGIFLVFTRKNLLIILICAIIGGTIGYFKSEIKQKYTVVQAIVKVNLIPGDIVHLILDKVNEMNGYSSAFNKNIISASTTVKPINDVSGSLGWNNSELIELNYTLKSNISSADLDKELTLLLKDNKQISHYFLSQKHLVEQRLEQIESILNQEKEEDDSVNKLRLVDAKVSSKATLSQDIYEILSFQSRTIEEVSIKPIIAGICAGIVLGYVIAVLMISLKTVREMDV